MTRKKPDSIDELFPGDGTEIPSDQEWWRADSLVSAEQWLAPADRAPLPTSSPVPDSIRTRANNRAWLRSQLRRRYRRAGLSL
ncbi:hypothetical protein ACT3SZ_15035 [Corynebacterium sp. AOP40-9SA-29]|uniref:hypothetical protein n=1 Tax=Corynebacterium sp. AOP40-9SA-29 TaxID=3457677 RepID=UPI0040337B8A